MADFEPLFFKEPLGFDLECSGFFAGRLEKLREFAPDSPVIFLSRHPEHWIGSVVNYFSALDDRVSYNYIARKIFDPICKVPVEKFYSLDNKKQATIVNNLMEFWVAVYRQAISDSNSFVVPLEHVDDRLEEIARFLKLPCPPVKDAWKRENNNKKRFILSDYVDATKYHSTIKMLGYNLGGESA